MSSPLPTRLFKLNTPVVRHADESFDLANNSLGTIITGGAPPVLESCNYCAISHVWGKPPPKFPCKGIPWDVPISSKEKLIFMLKACERRGYEYVWIDLLCINQADREDGNAEVPKMQQYYKNAHTTIVFGSSWRDFAPSWARVEARITGWNEDWKRGINANWDGIADIDRFINDDWFWRVWTLQETVIPLTTNPLAPVVKGEAPYNRSRLLTSDGTPLDIRGLCSLIEWTYIALGRLDYTTVTGTYSWIHPGAGIVNDHGTWWMMATLNHAIELGAAPLHPILAMRLTRYRNSGKPVDALRGVYALIDPDWQLETLKADTRDFPARLLADKYIAKREGALLLTMAVNPGEKTRTWAAGAFPESDFGTVVPDGGRYPFIGTPSVDDQGALSFEAAGLASNVTVHRDKPYGDGSGELKILIRDLYELQKSSIDITAIVTLITSAIHRSQIDETLNSLDDINSFINGPGISNANAVSSALRGAFSGWNRWIFIMEDNTAVLGWLPLEAVGSLSSSYSLLWLSRGTNEWAVIVEGDPKAGCTKVGIAFVNSTEPVGSQTGVKIL